jgi:hypothetical protein
VESPTFPNLFYLGNAKNLLKVIKAQQVLETPHKQSLIQAEDEIPLLFLISQNSIEGDKA